MFCSFCGSSKADRVLVVLYDLSHDDGCVMMFVVGDEGLDNEGKGRWDLRVKGSFVV